MLRGEPIGAGVPSWFWVSFQSQSEFLHACMRAYGTYEIRDTRYEIRNTGSTGVAVTVVVTIRHSVFGQGGARREASMPVVDAIAQR